MNKIILVGGIYGSGKSTLGRSMEGEAHVVDYDHIIGDVEGNGFIKTQKSLNGKRELAWKSDFLFALEFSAEMHPLTVGLGTFGTRERRDLYYNHLSQFAEVTGLYLMLPMRETVARIRADRPEGEKLVNATTVLDFYRTYIRTFKSQDNRDLQLPDEIPAEYKSLLCASGYVSDPSKQRWQVLTRV